MHAVAPEVAEYVLSGQYEQPYEPVKAANMPAEHDLHEAPVNGFTFWKVPAGHGEHLPVPSMYVPYEQPHWEAPAEEYVPEAQSLHSTDPVSAAKVLEGHASHEAAPSALW